MTVILEKKKNGRSWAEQLGKLPAASTKKFNAAKFCGKIKFSGDALSIQKKLRNEWR